MCGICKVNISGPAALISIFSQKINTVKSLTVFLKNTPCFLCLLRYKSLLVFQLKCLNVTQRRQQEGLC